MRSPSFSPKPCGQDSVSTEQDRLPMRPWPPFVILNRPARRDKAILSHDSRSAEVQQHRRKPPDNRLLNATTKHCVSRLPNREL